MSDPAKSASEIEDVLASIRRLVSESQATPARAVSPAPVSVAVRPRSPDHADGAPDAVAAGAGGASKLVLTPALRVTDPDDPWAPVPVAEEVPPPGAAPVEEGEADPDWDPEDRLADWGEIEESAEESVADAIAEQQAEPFFPPPHPVIADPDPDAADVEDLEDLAQLDGAGTEDLADFEPETGDANWPDTSAGSALRDLALARGQGTAPHAEAEAEAELTEDEAESPMTPELPRQDPARTDAPPMFSRRLDVRRAQVAQDGAGRRAEAAPEDAGEDVIDDEAEDGIEDLGEAASPFSFPETEDGLLDEETLRDIIAEVVREELQGALGQRITRNVRKMVRREIRLALAAEDLE